MKNFTFIILALFLYLNGHGQTEKGNFQIGIGGLPVISLNSPPVGYSLKAYLGYFPVNKLAVGIMPYRGKVGTDSSFGANVYVRYYLSDNNLSLFLEATTGIGNLKNEYFPQFKETLNTITIGPGIHYVFNKRMSVELHLQYARLKNISDRENGYTLNTFIPSIGIQYFIRK